MSATDDLGRAPEAPVEDRTYLIVLRVDGRVEVYVEADSPEAAELHAESCDIDPSDIDVIDAVVLSIDEYGS